MRNYFKMVIFLKGHGKLFFAAVSTMLVASFFEVFQLSLIVPIFDVVFNKRKIIVPNEFVQSHVDKINNMDPQALFPILIVGFLIMLFLKNILTFGYQFLMNDVSQRVMRDIRFILYEKIQNLSLEYFSKKRTGELISRITNDVQAVENALSYGLTDLFRQTFTIIFWICVAFTIDPRAAMVIFIIFPLIGIPMNQIGKRLKKISRSIQEKMADMSSLLLETISGVKLVKAFGTENYEKDRFKKQNQEFYKLRIKSSKRLIVISPLTDMIGGLLGIGLVVWVVGRISSEQVSVGVTILFFASFFNLISPIKKLGNVHAINQQALAASDRIYEVLDAMITVIEKPKAVTVPELSQSIRLNDVSFHYDKESGNVLNHVNLEINKGELVAIVGPTGTGKTTLVNLIPRFYDVTEGSVTIDGVDVKDASFQSLRGQTGTVTQETILFNDTVKANIAYGYFQASQFEIEEAAKKAFAHAFISKLPQGYDTLIGDRGFRLSGGEKQRLSIARAILKNPPILILDEATSSLDSESEKYIQEALDALMKGRTVIAIAHRLSTIKKADKIVVMEQGKIIGQGKHEELLKTCALYEKLYSMQFQA